MDRVPRHRSLHIGNGAQLVIELKSFFTATPPALNLLFRARPELLDGVAVIMSFDVRSQ